MRYCIWLLLGLVMSSIGANALNFNEQISVNGTLNAASNAKVVGDSAAGTGNQIYVKQLNLIKDSSKLKSTYFIYGHNQTDGKGNSYSISMDDLNGLSHTISASGDSLASNCLINMEGSEVATDYNINAIHGDLKETVKAPLENRGNKGIQNLVETNASGTFKVNSALQDTNNQIFDAAYFVSKLNAVEVDGQIISDGYNATFAHQDLTKELEASFNSKALPQTRDSAENLDVVIGKVVSVPPRNELDLRNTGIYNETLGDRIYVYTIKPMRGTRTDPIKLGRFPVKPITHI